MFCEMKKIKKYSLKSFYLLALLVLFSCSDEFSADSGYGNNKPPSVSSVSEAGSEVPVTQGVLENTYVIRGNNLKSLTSIKFNGYEAGFNPALSTEQVAFVKVPENAPYLNQPNIMNLESLGGSVDFDFALLTIETFTEGTENGVKVVNLLGGDFTSASKVTFVSGSEEQGNLVETPATILDVSEARVTVEVPSGIEQAFIFLETSRGAIAQSDSYGFNYSIYIDALNIDWSTSEWGGTHDLFSTEQALGEFSIKSIREGWSGLTFWPDNAVINYADYNSITVQIFGVDGSTSVNLALNDFETSVQLELVPGEWKKFVIPLSDFYPNGGEPDTIFRIDFQESSGSGLAQYIFYVDDFGFL